MEEVRSELDSEGLMGEEGEPWGGQTSVHVAAACAKPAPQRAGRGVH